MVMFHRPDQAHPAFDFAIIQHDARGRHLNRCPGGSVVDQQSCTWIGEKLEGLVDFECSRNPNVTSVGFQSLATLKKLRKLIVHDTAFDDAALQSLAKSRSLKELGIKKTAVTEAAAKAFQKQRPDVKLER